MLTMKPEAGLAPLLLRMPLVEATPLSSNPSGDTTTVLFSLSLKGDAKLPALPTKQSLAALVRGLVRVR